MRCPTIAELPPPPIDRVGWPWTEAKDWLPELQPNGQAWPKVTIVTPSYNQGHFLEETIRSVLLQGYPDLEYIVIDGGSTDRSVETIRKYERWLSYWVSEKDSGQTQAINKGFARSTGEICAYLNSDDVYLPNALRDVGVFFGKHPDATVAYGDCQIIDESSRLNDLWIAPEFDPVEFLFRCYIPQPATFWRRSATSAVGTFNQGMHYAFDYEMWLRIGARHRLLHVPVMLAQHRKAEGTKTVSKPEAFAAEIIGALENFFSSPDLSVELKSIEADAYAHAFFNQALLNFRLERIAEARAALQSTFRHSPGLVSAQRERTIRALVDFADPLGSLEDAQKYLDLVFAQLPEDSHTLSGLRASVWRRVEILHAARSKDRRALRRARGLLLSTLIDDSDWMRNRAARGEMLKVLIGQRAIHRLAEFKHLLRTVRSAFLNTRKDYA